MKNRTPVICDRCRAAGYLGQGKFSEMQPLTDFKPVPRQTKRHDGWTPKRQRAFIEALARTGSVTRAAEAVNMAKEGAYLLRHHKDAAEFNAAWDKALDFGTRILADAALDRSIHGVPVPIFHQGEQVGERRVYNERLTMWQLQHRMPDKFGQPPARGTKSWKTEQREDWQSREDARARTIQLVIIHYQNRVQLERMAREEGDIAAADFYLRQLTYFEILLECGNAAMDLIDIALGRRNHKRPWETRAGAEALEQTPLTEAIRLARLSGWEQAEKGAELINQAGHDTELEELAARFGEAFEGDGEE